MNSVAALADTRPAPTSAIETPDTTVSARETFGIDRVQATATHFVLKAYKRDGVAFADAEPDHRLPVTP